VRDTAEAADESRRGTELRSVANALRLMEAISDAGVPLAVTDLAAQLGLAASTTHRILATLAAQGFVVRVPSRRRYRPGPGLARLGRPALMDNARLLAAARQTLERLAQLTGETTQLTVLEGWEAVAVDHADGTQPIIAHHPAGARIPAHATAVGQAILAHLPDLAARIARDGLVAHSPRTITDRDAFEAELARIRERGYARNIGQLDARTAGAAAAIFDEWDAVIGSVGVTGPTERIGHDALLAEIGARTVAAATEIHDELVIGARETAALSQRPAAIDDRSRA
jgi:IclR family transcriptional regulator, KDG regulon repressor